MTWSVLRYALTEVVNASNFRDVRLPPMHWVRRFAYAAAATVSLTPSGSVAASATPLVTALSDARWVLTPNIHAVERQTGSAFEYDGAGAEDDDTVLARRPVPVVPGMLYVFSARIDPRSLRGGAFALVIYSPENSFRDVRMSRSAGSNMRYVTPAWQCPPGVATAMLGMQLLSPNVPRGSQVTFSNPTLTEIRPPQTPERWTGATDVALPQIFSDHMVLQRDASDVIWGTADPASGSVLVTLAGHEAIAAVDRSGRWRATLSNLPVGGPYVLMVTGAQTIAFIDVLVGDVYVASGQSNMTYAMDDDPVNNAVADRALDDGLREFSAFADLQPHPQNDFHEHSTWLAADDAPLTEHWSAVGYYFGERLRAALGVPIGIIDDGVGSTVGQSWLSADAVQRDANIVLEGYSPQERNAVLAGRATASDLPANYSPSFAYNAMVNPLVGFGVKGVLWYQGEGNSADNLAGTYRGVLADIIADWRRQWGTSLPFYVVQLPGIGPATPDPNTESGLALVREAQLDAALTISGTSLAVAIDLGDAAGDLHPPDKVDVGARLAQLVLQGATGPLYAGFDVEDTAIRIRFTHTDGGLVARGERLGAFAIAGADRHFFWATARIEGDTVVVSSPSVARPASVRYAWADNPRSANLYNGAGYPASPFRTDDW